MSVVYLATAGEYSDFRVLNAFARREDAEAYQLGEDVKEMTVRDGPVEVRHWHSLAWRADWPDRERDGLAEANPWSYGPEMRDFDGDERHAEHAWHDLPAGAVMLTVSGWDLSLVKKVYSEQRAQYLARKEGVA